MGRFGGDERVVKEERDLPILLDPTSEELKLLVRIRDEAHRFAITFSRKLRAKQAVTSVLETIPGVGTKRARALLKRFGGLAGVKRASAEELASTPGMNSETAAAVAAWVRGRSDSTDPSNRS
jgi:excinuclease ABC subunit C